MRKEVSFGIALVFSISVINYPFAPFKVVKDENTANVEKTYETQTVEVEKPAAETVETLTGVIIETDESLEARSETPQKDILVGFIEDIDMEKVTVLTDDGSKFSLPIGTARLDFKRGLRVGTQVEIEYLGRLGIKDNTSSEIELLRIADSAAEGSKEENANQQSQNQLKGVLENISLGKLTVIGEDGGKEIFKIMNAPLYFENGITKGIPVTIYYSGGYAEGNTKALEVTYVCSDGAVQETEAEALTEAESEAATETETETMAAAETEIETEKEMIVVEDCNIRIEPNIDSGRVGVVDAGETVICIRELDDGWSEVRYQETTGYIKSEFLQ